MATRQPSKQASRTRAAAARKPARSSGGGRSGTATRGTRRPDTGSVEPGAFSRAASAVFDGHGHDVAGVACVVLGIVAAVGLYMGSAGPVGRWIETVLGTLVGLLRVFAPPLLLVGGVVLIRGRRDSSAELTETEAVEADASLTRTVRRSVGIVLATVSVAGLLHLAVDTQTITAGGLDAYSAAGGLLGGGVGGGLRSLVGGGVAAVIFVLVAMLAAAFLIGRPLRDLLQYALGGATPAREGLGSAFSSLFRVGEQPEESDDFAVGLYDYDSDPATAKRSRPKRAKSESAAATIRLPEVSIPTEVEQLEIQLQPRGDSPWKLPPLSLLSRSKAQQHDEVAIAQRGRQLEGALAEHGVTTRLSGMVVGPTVTRYELELGTGIKVRQVESLTKDIAYAMASKDVRILAPIPGKQAVGVEVPNEKRQIIALGDILASPEALRAKSPLSVAVGRNIEGKAVMCDLAKMPHILIAGQTGAGKSSCINSIMTSILMRATPDEVRLILVDPKRVELTQYNRVPHLLTQVVTDPKKAANALAWAVQEMERRYELLEEVGVRDITGYNGALDRGELRSPLGEEREFVRMPLILIVVDELADLMIVAARDVEESINRIAAKARAVGIHLVIATQRPSVNVITGVIKANIPARFAFSVASATDSKVIMNHGGAERLVGQGDMLLLDPASPSAERIQGCWVEEKEAAAVVRLWRDQSPEVHYVQEVQDDANLAAVALPGSQPSPTGSSAFDSDDDDDLLGIAMEAVVRGGYGSTSMLQRKLKVGFARAGRLMDLLEEKGVVGPSQGSKPRTVLMTVEEYLAATGQLVGADLPPEELEPEQF